MEIQNLNYFTPVDSEQDIIGGNTTGFSWLDWLQDYPSFEGNTASASFFASATGDNTYTDVQATLIVTENSSSSSVSVVSISSSS